MVSAEFQRTDEYFVSLWQVYVLDLVSSELLEYKGVGKVLLVLLKLNGAVFESHLRSTLAASGLQSLSPDICTSVRYRLL